MELLSCGIIYVKPNRNYTCVIIIFDCNAINYLTFLPKFLQEIPDKIQSLKFMDTVLSSLGRWGLGPKISLYRICTDN